MGSQIYKQLCKSCNLNYPQANQISSINENDAYKLLWDFPIKTFTNVTHNRPDMILINKLNKKATVFDFSTPWDTSISDKYNEKVSKYIALAEEIRKLWTLSEVKIQPIIIGCLGSYSKRMKREILLLNTSFKTNINITSLQEATVQETVNIAKSVMRVPT